MKLFFQVLQFDTSDLPATSSTGCLSGWISICRAIHLPSKCANHQPFFLYSSSRCWSAGRTNGIRKYLCAGSRSVLLLFPGWAYDGANYGNCFTNQSRNSVEITYSNQSSVSYMFSISFRVCLSIEDLLQLKITACHKMSIIIIPKYCSSYYEHYFGLFHRNRSSVLKQNPKCTGDGQKL